MAANLATRTISEDDDNAPGGGDNLGSGTPRGGEREEFVDVGNRSVPEGAGQRAAGNREPEPEFEEILGDEDLGAGDGGGEGRLTEAEGGERPLLEQPRSNGRVYSRDEVLGMSAEQRKQLWKGMSREDRQANRALNRARTKDARRDGRELTTQLQRQVADQATELAELRRQVGGFAPRFNEFQRSNIQGEINRIDQAIAEENRKFEAAGVQMEEAMGASDGRAHRLANDARNEAFLRREQLKNRRAQLDSALKTAPAADAGDGAGAGARGNDNRQGDRQQQQQPGDRSRRVPVDPEVVERAEDFIARHSWYDPDAWKDPAGDVDSRIVASLDSSVQARGFKPNTDEYWDELEDLMQEYLPHRMRGERAPAERQDPPQRRAAAAPSGQQRAQVPAIRRGPATGGGGEGGQRGGGRIQVRMTEGRKEALIEAGVRDRQGNILDRPKFNRLMSAYAAQDREAQGARR